jgi:DNA-binding beta-propeller fold protein YncE
LLFVLLLVPGRARSDAPVYVGSFTSPGLCSPRGIDLAPSGELFVGSDCLALMHMERFSTAGSPLGTWAFPPGYFGAPNGVAVDALGNVYVTDYGANSILKFTSAGTLQKSWSSLSSPADLVIDGSGNVLALELGGSKLVKRFTPNGVLLGTIGTVGSGPGQFQDPVGMGMDGSGRLYVADFTGKKILRFLPDGSFDMEFGTTVEPQDVAAGPDGKIYVITFDINGDNNQVRQYSSTGALLDAFGAPQGMDGAFRVLIAPTGTIYITVQRPNNVAMFQIDLSTAAVPSTFGRLKAMYR